MIDNTKGRKNMNIVKTVNGEEIRLELEGKINAANSGELQEAIISSFQTAKNVVIDFGNVPYVASAGLRALLLGHKTAVSKSGCMKLINVNDEVMEVLRMTGFLSALNVE